MMNAELVKIGADAIQKLNFPEDVLPLGVEGRKMLAEAVLNAAATACSRPERSKPSLAYRPNEFDDWGMIRNSDGTMFATVRRPLSNEQADEARRTKTDPYEAISLMLISAAEGIMSEPVDARRRLIEMCAAVAAAENARNVAESENIEAAEWERVVASHHAEAAKRIRAAILLLADTFAPPARDADL